MPSRAPIDGSDALQKRREILDAWAQYVDRGAGLSKRLSEAIETPVATGSTH